jgi:hypothetical protein
MGGTTIVTGGDAGYYPLLEELAQSVRDRRSADQVGLAVIDGGLTSEQKQELSARYGARILDIGWGFDVPASRIKGREHLKVLTGRSYLDQHLPEADVIVWIDGDAWVQDFGAIDMMAEAAMKDRLVAVSQTSRYSKVVMTLDWAPFGYAKVKSQLYKNARRAGLAEAECRLVGDKPTYNAGVFALARTAPHWATWRARIAQVIRKGRVFTADQLAMGLMIHADGLPVEHAPEICNYMGPWTCTADGKTLVERYIPNAPVGVIHMAGYDALRRDKAMTVPIQAVDGGSIDRSLRYFAWRDSTAAG